MKKYLGAIILAFFFSQAMSQYSEALMTTPEKTNYQETSTYADVMSFLKAISEKSDLIHQETLVKSTEGKDVPLVVLARPKISTPEEAVASGKPVVFIQANIHGGEVEGKEAVMAMMRDILIGEKAHLLDEQIIIFVPIYNSDGNDKMGPDTRRSQEGSPVLAGERRSGGDFDLNRDGMKMEAVETKALIASILKWDPALFVDLHTTNGTWHGNELTFAPSYHHAGHPATSEYTMDVMLPAIQKTVKEKNNLHFGIYGGYSLRQGWPPKNLYTYNHHPRYLVNQFGLRNKMGILSETFAHDRFYERINAAYVFVNEILEYTNIHGNEIVEINQKAEEETLKAINEKGGTFTNGVRYKMVPTKEPLTLRTYDYVPYTNDKGETRYARTGNIIDVEGVNNYNAFEATDKATVPKGYVIPAQFAEVVAKLKSHGVKVETLTETERFTGEVFYADSLKIGRREFEHHKMARLHGTFKKKTGRFSEGDFKVNMNQPLANLIFYLLEPESDDGLANWNYFDEYMMRAGVETKKVQYPVFKYW